MARDFSLRAPTRIDSLLDLHPPIAIRPPEYLREPRRALPATSRSHPRRGSSDGKTRDNVEGFENAVVEYFICRAKRLDGLISRLLGQAIVFVLTHDPHPVVPRSVSSERFAHGVREFFGAH